MYELSFKKGVKSRIIAKVMDNKKADNILYLNDIVDTNVKKDKKIISISEYKLQVLPNNDVVEKIYVSAPSGAGKSTFTANWIKYGKKYIKPKVEEVYIFSSIDDDPPLDKLNPVRIDLDDGLYENMFEAEEMENSIVIFDDVDTMMDKVMRYHILKFKDFLLEQGRHYNIRMIMTSHLMSNYTETRCTLNEATAVCFFPHASSTYHIKNFLKTHGGFEKQQIEWILSIETRWICLYKTMPQYLIWETGAVLCRDI